MINLTRVEKFIAAIILGFAPPVIFLLIFWWSSYFLSLKEADIIKASVAGLIIGSLVDLIFIKRWLKDLFKFKRITLILFYFFYMFGLFGFFMGVPVFNTIPGIVAGVYIARRDTVEKDIKLVNKKVKNIHLFNIFTLLPFLLFSAYLAINDKSTAANLEGMFNLNFRLQTYHIISIIIFGGLCLVAFQYFITNFLTRWIYKGKEH